MADINVDVNLPSTISVDVTSPTQVLATNISIPGPQGPRGEKGNPTSINNLTAENIIITGSDGNIVYNSGLNTIFISGNSGYFQSAINSLTTNLNNTGANLNTSINNLSGLFTGYTGTLDATYATDAQLASTGNTLNIKIDNLSGYVNSQDTNISNNLASTGSSLQSNINTLSSNLNSTGSNLENKITSLSGTLTGNYLTTNVASNTYATISNLNSTGSTLNSSISSLSGTLTSNYATITNLASTGSNLQNQINNLDNVYATDASVTAVANNLASTGNALETKIGSLSGTLTSNYATITNLASTGSTLNNNINSLSGTLTSNYATITNLASTGSTLISSINSLNSAFTGFTGNLDATYASDSQLATTGLSLINSINSLSGTLTGNYVTKSNGQFTDRPSVNGTGVLLSGEAAALPTTIVYTTGNQTISGNKTFINNIYVSGTGYFENINISNLSELVLSGTKITISGNSGVYSYTNIYISGNPVLTGVNLSSYATVANLETTGSTLNNSISSLSGTLTSTYATITNLASTGSTLNTKINDLSGYVNTQDNSISSNLISTGNTLQNSINSLSGSSVLLYGNQSVGGVKTFRDNVYINNLFVTGTETIVSTNNFNVQSPYLLLNLTGGAVDGGIFFVTGCGLTGINDTGPIIGFDHVNKFKFGISTRNSDLSTLPDIASVQDIQAYSGVADNKFSTITNLASTGNTLEQKISSLSGTLTSTYATITNLASTGSTLATNLASTGNTLNTSINSLSGTLTGNYATILNLASTGNTLNTRINSLSGTLTSNYATITNLASTGSTLNSSINSLSGTLTSTYATITNLASTGNTLATNLASTGSTLNTRINNLSGYINSSASNIIFTTGNQTISGNKTFVQDTTFGDSTQGDFLVISGNNFTVYGSGNFTSGLFVNGNAVLTGVNLSSYATVANLASTGSTLNNSIILLSGTLTGNYLTTSSASSTYATITNLASTGSTLNTRINSLSGTLTGNYLTTSSASSTYATITNLISTGSTLNTRINNLSGYINSTSSNIVFTTGNQNISGTKTFTNGTLNISIKPQNSGLEIDNGPFIIRSAAGTFGAARVEILNENGANGFTVVNEGLDLADFGLQSSNNKKINFRMEGREEYANGNNQEFQIIDVSDDAVYYARFGNNNIVIGENTEKIGIGTLSPSEKLEVNGNIKFGDPSTASAILYMYDSPNDAYHTASWTDSELQLTQTTDLSNLTIAFSEQGNTLVSNGSFLKLPTGKNDFIAMDAEVVHKTGNETISGVKTFATEVNISGNLNLNGDITISGNSIYSSLRPPFPKITTSKKVYLPEGVNYSTLGGAPATYTASSGYMSLYPYYLPTNMTGTNMGLTTSFYTTSFSGPQTSGSLVMGIYDATSGLENAVLMESFVIQRNTSYNANERVQERTLSKFYKKGWYITAATRFASGSQYTGALIYSAVAPPNLHVFGTPTGSTYYSSGNGVFPVGYNQPGYLSITGMGYPLPNNLNSVPQSNYIFGGTVNAPPVYLMY